MGLLLRNDIIQSKDDGVVERILWLDVQSNACITIVLEVEKLKINNRKLDYLENELRQAKVIILKNDPAYRFTGSLRIAESRLLELRWKIIKHILDIVNEPDIYSSEIRGRAVETACNELKFSKPTIYKCLRLFWQGGCDKRSLISDRYRCGGPHTEKKLGEKKTGRPNSYVVLGKRLEKESFQGKEGRNITESDKDNIKDTIDRYLRNSDIKISQAYQFMLQDYYFEEVNINGVIEKKILDASKVLTERQFRYWVEIKLNEDKPNKLSITMDRLGVKKFNKDCKGLSSTTAFESFYVGFLMEIDACFMPFYLLNRFKNRTVGRPIVYSIVEALSGYICAIFVTLFNPSRMSASEAILNLVRDKNDYCKQYGLENMKYKWLDSGLPKYLLADRGEFAGKFSEELVEKLGITIQNTPSWAANLKPNVEQSHRLLKKELFKLPGKIDPDYRERGTPDYRKDAKMTLEEFTKAVILAVIKVNNRRMNNYVLTEEMIKDDVRKTPFSIYNWGIKKYPNIMRKVSAQFIQENILEHNVASITESGINLNGYIYECDKSRQEQWNTIAKNYGSWKNEICYDTQNMDTIFLINHSENATLECRLVDRYQHYKGMSYEELVMESLYNSTDRLDYRDIMNDISLQTDNGMSALIGEANESFKHLNPEGKVDIKHIKEAKREEMEQGVSVISMEKDSISENMQNQIVTSKLSGLLKHRRDLKNA